MKRNVLLPIMSPTLVGREDHFATLHTLIEQVQHGQGHVALVSGEAGIGKSRLVAEVKNLAMKQGFLLLQGQCFPTDLTYPYAPLVDLLRTLFASSPSAAVTTAIKALACDIYPLLPELVSSPIPPSQLEPEQEKRRLFAVMTTFYNSLAINSPLLLVIEDVHWCDDTSLDFLLYLARHSVSSPLLILATYRHDEVQQALKNWRLQLERTRLMQEIHLTPLTRQDIDTMLSAIFVQQNTSFDMRRFLHGDLLNSISTLTEGNPFFIEETLSSLIAAGDIFYREGFWNRATLREMHIPRSVQDAVQQRIAHVSEGARYVLTLAAVAGRQFDFALLQQLTHYDENQLLEFMKELRSAQLVVEESSEQFAFRHALTRQAIYADLLTRERIKLHCIIAEVLERLSPTIDGRIEDIAYHFYHGNIWQKAMDYAQRAGKKALQLYSHHAAITYFSWSIDAVQHLSTPPSSQLYRVRGQTYEIVGEFEKAQNDYMNSLDIAHNQQEGIAEWQSIIDLGFLWVGRDYTQAESWFRRALLLAQNLHNPMLHARSLNRIGNWHLNLEQPREALQYHQEALTIFQHLNDARGIAETLDLLGMCSYLGGDLAGGTTYCQQAIVLFDKLDDLQGKTSSLATLALRGPTYQTDTMASVATLAEARKDAEHALRIARQIGQRSAEAYALFQLGLCLGSEGNYTEALSVAQQSLDVAEEIEHRQWQTAAHTILGGIYSGFLAYTTAQEHFERAYALARESGSLFWTHIVAGYLASAYILLNNVPQAQQILASTLTPETPAQTMAQRMLWSAAVELELAQGNPTQALKNIDKLIEATQSVGGQSSLRISTLHGEALVALQRTTEAEAAFTIALSIALTQNVKPMQWRLYIALGNLYQAQGRSTKAENAFSAARKLIEELAKTLADESLREHFLFQATALLPPSQTSSPLPASTHETKHLPGGLTGREREVVLLIAEGKSNQAIADSLVVTKRTVETHISNIMFKLGHTSRTQIAVWAVENGIAN